MDFKTNLTDKIKQEFRKGVDSLPSSAKMGIGVINEKKETIKFKSWRKSIINALTFLDNDYDLGMPGEDKNKQIFKDDLINLLGNCPNYRCVSKILKKTFKNKEIIDNIMDKAYEDYTTKGLNPKSKDETTTSASSGQYSGPLFGGTPKFKSNVDIHRTDETLKKSEIEKLVKETIQNLNTDESTTASSAGPYVGTAIWAKNRENWRGKNKLWKGGKFVSVKEKCKKYPYCNQSPEAIILSDVPMDKLDHVFERLSKKTNKPYSYIKRMFFKHFDVK
jgi:hypothetical protein